MRRLFILTSLLLSILIPLASTLPAPIQPTPNLSLTPSSTNQQGTVATTSRAPTPHPTERAHLLLQLHKRQGSSIWSTITEPFTTNTAPNTKTITGTTYTEQPTNPPITTTPITEPSKTRSSNPTTDPKTSIDGGGGIPVTTATVILPSPSSGSGDIGGGTASKGATVGETGIGAGSGSGMPTSGPGSVPNTPMNNGNNSGSESGSSSSSGSSMGAIIGGIAAAVVIIVAMAGFLFYRRRNRRSSLENAQDRLDAKERGQGAGGGGDDDPPLMEDGKIEETLIGEKDVTGEGARTSGLTSAAAIEEELGGPVTRIRGPQVLHADIDDLNVKTPLHEFEAQRNSWLALPPPLESPRSPQDTIQQDHLLRLLRVQQEQMEKLQHLVVQHRRSQTPQSPQSPQALDPAVEGGDSSGIASGTGFGGGDGVAVQNLVSPGENSGEKSHEPKDLDRSDLSGLPASKLDDIDDDGYSVTTTKVDDNSNTTSQSNSNKLVEFVTPGAANINTATAFCADRDSVVKDPTVSSTTGDVSEERAALISAIAVMKAQYDEQYQLIHEDLAGTSSVP